MPNVGKFSLNLGDFMQLLRFLSFDCFYVFGCGGKVVVAVTAPMVVVEEEEEGEVREIERYKIRYENMYLVLYKKF